ncbi:MAG TPA: tRNA (5-methylaminomethyl-2-thiouridine)(34)-methyltransferase MnmD [Bacteroidales bacterium]|nr:tRNA (5-methylaminomethyl-2-thiouridine)(34)-methyltransferase MnmD [Bacteroidales bacterium]
MDKTDLRLTETSDGSHTLFVPLLNEHYHSVNGAVNESMIVFIRNGYEFCRANPLNILEIGLGTGLNALLTLMRSVSEKRRVNYTAIEKYPLDDGILSALNHSSFAGNDGVMLSKLIHSAEWNRQTQLNDYFILTKIMSDFVTDEIPGFFDLVYFDAFGPEKQPEMWDEALFRKIACSLNEPGVLVTYSVKGSVKRALKASGFSIELLKGPPGKREVLRAVKKTLK